MPNTPVLLAISNAKQRSPLLSQLADRFNIDYAVDSDQVIDKTSEDEPVSLLLIDIDSLAGKASELCLWLKTDQETKDIPLAVIGDDESTIENWVQMGARDYLCNSTPLELAVARIQNQLELKYKSDLLGSIAQLDSLTSLSNKARLDEFLHIEWRRSLREYYPISLIKLDLDEFATFNDQYGLGVGDDALRRVARCLQQNSARAGDMVSRYSNDEFVVMLPVTELDNALVVAERMVEAIAALAIPHDGSEEGVLTASAGVATIEPSIDKRYQDLFDEVDEMLHSAQQAGGNCAQGVAI